MTATKPLVLALTILILSCWNRASSATYYVEKTGNDQNTCLSVAQACLTIKGASQLATQPGDVVQVGPGDFPERVRITTGGIKGKPIKYTGQIRSACPTTAIRDPNSRMSRPAPGTTIQGFSIAASYVTVDCFNIVGSKVAGITGSGVFIEGNQQDITVVNNRVDASQTPGRPWAAVAMNGNAPSGEFPKNITVARNYVLNTGYGFMIFCGDNCLFTENEVEQLIADGRGDNDYARVFGENVTLTRNYFHGNRSQDCEGCHIDCFQSYNVGQPGNFARRIVIDSNTCFGFHQGVIIRDITSKTAGKYASHSDWKITNNVFGFGPEGGTSSWCGLFDHVGAVVFEHNLCVETGVTGYLNGTSAEHRFNIHLNTGWKPYVSTNPGWQNGQLTAEGNLLYRDERQYTQSDWPGDFINLAPVFVDATKRNFRISPRSPARNTARGSSTKVDRIGIARPQESIADIGPYEYRPTSRVTRGARTDGSEP